jgi:hypothetical protein
MTTAPLVGIVYAIAADTVRNDLVTGPLGSYPEMSTGRSKSWVINAFEPTTQQSACESRCVVVASAKVELVAPTCIWMLLTEMHAQ